ncbi:hypothetical protein ACHHYP_00510 [Achlya hypogyna]|uniref:CCAAT-binding factor domain-containing protein n=1 Tax=Achlya hypogyna TaxID=1202772 RepID=A0A1V9ZUC5_ACHHY|nr:hypothetical protein ACHHYP_00510 [Achlya hypogyna]
MGNNKKGPKKAAGGPAPVPAHGAKKPTQKPQQANQKPQQPKPQQNKPHQNKVPGKANGKPNTKPNGKASGKADEAAGKPAGKNGGKPQQGKPHGKAEVKKAAEPEDTKPNEKLVLMLKNMKDNAVPWYMAVKPLAHRENEATKYKPNDPVVEEKRKLAESALEAQLKALETKGGLSSDEKYLKTMMKSGTLADRIAATTLAIQGSPIHNLQRLSQLVTMAKNKSRRESQMAVDSLKDLFLNNLLPDRKLHFFHQQPIGRPEATLPHLVMWYFEHCIKMAFSQLIAVLSNGMNDAIDVHKRACIRAVVALLTEKPEQEAVLLSMLVNKLGDPERKIAAYVLHQLQELLKTHPVMKRVVVDDVERLLTRTKVTERTKYNAVLFLNQLYLDAKDKELATHLIKVYFGLFTKEVHKSDGEAGGLERKLLSALLVGVNRSFPYAECTSADFQSEIDTMFRVVHTAHFSTSVQALLLLFQVMNSTNSVPDRFYTALYAKLLDPKLPSTSKHTMFLNVLYRAMKHDVSPARVNAMIKRLLQVAYTMSPAFACASLYLVSQVMAQNSRLRSLIDMSEGGDIDVVETTEALAANAPSSDEKDDSEDDATKAADADEVPADDEEMQAERARSAALLASMGLDGADEHTARPAKPAAATEAITYDAKKRNPLYSGAENACLWELQPYLQHYHPSVATFAKQLIEGPITYGGDPLTDFTLTTFFDKFVNKKPKAKDGPHQRGSARPTAVTDMYSEEFQTQDEANVEESDRFFYTFFKERAKRTPKKPKKEPRDADGSEDEEYEAFAQQLAEGLMQDNDDEDVNMDDWSGPDDDSDDDGADASELLANEFPDSDDEEGSEIDDEELMQANGHSLGNDDDAFLDDDDDDEDADVEDDEDEVDDEEDEDDEEDDMVFQEDKTAKFKGKGKKAPVERKRKSPFASADDYLDQIAELQAQTANSKPKKGKKSRTA